MAKRQTTKNNRRALEKTIKKQAIGIKKSRPISIPKKSTKISKTSRKLAKQKRKERLATLTTTTKKHKTQMSKQAKRAMKRARANVDLYNKARMGTGLNPYLFEMSNKDQAFDWEYQLHTGMHYLEDLDLYEKGELDEVAAKNFIKNDEIAVKNTIKELILHKALHFDPDSSIPGKVQEAINAIMSLTYEGFFGLMADQQYQDQFGDYQYWQTIDEAEFALDTLLNIIINYARR